MNGHACYIPGVKRPERDVDHLGLFPSNTEVKMSGAITLLPIYAFMPWTEINLPLVYLYLFYEKIWQNSHLFKLSYRPTDAH
jgi:hypothetical protein